MVFDEQKFLEVFHFSPFIIYFWYYLNVINIDPTIFSGGYFIVYKQILKIIIWM